MSKRVAIVQSNYIPWKGYFDLIAAVDELILFDDMQYTRRDWRNRNLIKTPRGLKWLTIPVEVKGKFHQKICDVRVSDGNWGRRHWDVLRQNYHKTPFFGALQEPLAGLYLGGAMPASLSQINHRFITFVCDLLGIKTTIKWSMDYWPVADGKTERLVALCQQAGATGYLSGPSALEYIDAKQFEDAGVGLEFADYSGYPEYPQSYGSFEHGVSVLDLLFNTGPEAKKHMKKFAWSAASTVASPRENWQIDIQR
jgi:hypothetical protein